MIAKFLNYLKLLVRVSSLKTNKIITILFCVLIAFVFWFFQTLNQEYNVIVNFPIEYINVPRGKIISNSPPSKIGLNVITSGNQLIKYKIFGSADPILVDVSKIKYTNLNKDIGFYSIQFNRNLLQKQLGNKIQINKVGFDIIKLRFAQLVTRKKKIKVDVKINFNPQFAQSGYSNITPEYVMVKGPASILDTLKEIKTNHLVLNNVKNSINQEINLKKYNKNLKFSTTTVLFQMPVEKITEGSMKIKVLAKNLPINYTSKLFPATVEIIFKAPLSKYDKITANDFEVEVDFLESKNFTEKLLNVISSNHPDFVEVIKTNPSKVEYIIQK